MDFSRTRPPHLQLNNARRSNDLEDEPEEIGLTDVEHQGGYRPLHRDGLRSTLFEHGETLPPPSPTANPLMRSLYDLLEDPTSSQAAFYIHVFTTALIIISAIITILETLPPFHNTPSRVWFGLETALVVCFTVEYLCRAYAHSQSLALFWGWFGTFFAIVDLLAVAPYYIEIALQADTTAFFRFSILRTFRLLRVFRPFKYSSTILLTIEVMYLSMKRSKDALFALFFFALVVLVVFSTLLYFAERGAWDSALETFVDADGDPSQFASIPSAAWFVLVTITTVGYGEMIPRSFLGRLFTLPLLLFGLLLIALPSFVLGREFSALWEGMSKRGQFSASRERADSLSAFLDAHTPGVGIPNASSSRPQAQNQNQNQTRNRDRDTGEYFDDNGNQYPPPPPPAEAYSSSSQRSRVMLDEERDRPGEQTLSNRKLGKNQQVLSQQIEELAAMMKSMREEMRSLAQTQAVDGNGGHPL